MATKVSCPILGNGVIEMDSRAKEVLMFWFDGNIDENYKTKWFPTSSKSLQQHADEIITLKFSNLLSEALDHQLDDWLTQPSSTIALILVLDQFSRHIYRQLPSDAVERSRADRYALEVAEKLTSLPNWDKNMKIDEFIFSLMPFRHSATITRLQYVLESIDHRLNIHEKYFDLLHKFRKQTLRRLQHLQDRNAAQEAGDILEHHEFQGDETNIMSEPLVQSTKLFLEKYIHKQRIAFPDRDPVVSISLSGGVDSMVIAKILALLRSQFNIRQLFSMHIDYSNRDESKDEAAFVRDWAERHGFTHFERVISEVKRGVTDRSEYEKISRNIRYGFYKEILTTQMGWIDDIHSSEMNPTNGTHPGLECGLGVIFGHHAGDVQENVISNIMRGCSPLSLAGMHEAGITEGVPVWRPLLKHIKDEIFAFAHKYGVPYFRDTTPTWSTRGKLRQQLVPLLIDMYGTGCLRNISSLAAQSDEAMTLVSQNIYDPFMRTVQRYTCGIVFNVIPYRHQPLCFWKEMLKNIMHSMSMNMIREKAVLNFLKRIQLVTPSGDAAHGLLMQVPGWLELRKGFYTYLTSSGDLIIYRDGVVIPAIDERDTEQREMKITESSQLYPLGYEGHIGAWKITSVEVTADQPSLGHNDEGLTLEDVDEVIDFQSLLNGQFCYVMDVPFTVNDLRLHQSSSKPIGCSALWNIDTKLRLGVPFLIPNIPEVKEKKGKNKAKPHVNEAIPFEGRRFIVKYQYSPVQNATSTFSS